jgi:hypothetical protein
MTRLHVATAVLATLAVACGPTVPGAETSPGDSIVPPASTASTPADDVVRIPVSGTAPGALVFAGSRAWVLAGEGGTLMEVDLVGRRELRSIEVGFGATHLAVLDGVVAVGRFDDSGNGSHLVLVDLRTEEIRGVPTRPLGGLAVGDDGIVWALEQAGRLLKVDVGAGEIVAELAVEIGANVHTEVQWGAGSAWVGSDGTPVLRVRGDGLAIEATIDVPSGLPFLFEAGLVWGAGPTFLWAIDPTTNAVVRNVALDDVIEILGMAIDDEEAWLAVRRPGHVGRVLRLTLPAGDVVAELEVSLPAAVKIGPDRAWVASYLDNELVGFSR